MKTLEEIIRKVNVHGEEKGTMTELWGSSTLRNQKGAINEAEKNGWFSEFEDAHEKGSSDLTIMLLIIA